MYILGGKVRLHSVAKVDRYHPVTNRWEEVPAMPEPKAQLGVATLAGKVYALGGLHANACVSGSVFAFDPASDKWARCAKLPTARDGLACAALGGAVYALGGCGDDGKPLNAVEVYDPRLDA